MKRNEISLILFISLVILVSGKVFGGPEDGADAAKVDKAKKEQQEKMKKMQQQSEKRHAEYQKLFGQKSPQSPDAIVPPKARDEQISSEVDFWTPHHPPKTAAETAKKPTFVDKIKNWFTPKTQPPKQPAEKVIKQTDIEKYKKEHHILWVKREVDELKPIIKKNTDEMAEQQEAINKGSNKGARDGDLKRLQGLRDNLKKIQKVAQTYVKDLGEAIKEVEAEQKALLSKRIELTTDTLKLNKEIKKLQASKTKLTNKQEGPDGDTQSKIAKLDEKIKALEAKKASIATEVPSIVAKLDECREKKTELDLAKKTASAVAKIEIPADTRTTQQLVDTVSALRADKSVAASAMLKSAQKDAQARVKELEQKRKEDAKKLRGLRKQWLKQEKGTGQQKRAKDAYDAQSKTMTAELVVIDSLKDAIAGTVRSPTQTETSMTQKR